MGIKKMKALVPAGVLAATLFAIISLILFNSFAVAEDANEYPANEAGLTYGSAAYVEDPAMEPDLILVVATNGEEGYVYKTELDAASCTANNPEEAVKMTEERRQLERDAFAGILEKELEPYGIRLAPESVDSIYDSMSTMSIADAVKKLLESRAEGDTRSDEPLSEELAEPNWEYALSNAYGSMQHELKRAIPVYEKDGTTRIGEFLVG